MRTAEKTGSQPAASSTMKIKLIVDEMIDDNTQLGDEHKAMQSTTGIINLRN